MDLQDPVYDTTRISPTDYALHEIWYSLPLIPLTLAVNFGVVFLRRKILPFHGFDELDP